MMIDRPEAFARQPHAVLFDLDNTLYAYAPAHEAAARAVRSKVAGMLSVEPKEFDRAADDARRRIKERLGRTASSHNRLLYFQQTLEIMGLGSRILLALDLEQTYWRAFLENAALFDEVEDLIQDLRGLDVPMALVTDLTAQIQFRKLVYWGLDNGFDYIVTSEEAGFDKPHEAPFRIALEKLRPAGEVVWMVGDDPEADVWGARKSIGAVTLQKVHRGVPEGRGDMAPDARFARFGEVRDLVRNCASELRGGG